VDSLTVNYKKIIDIGSCGKPTETPGFLLSTNLASQTLQSVPVEN